MHSASLSIECSDQPLDFSFHPVNPNLVAAALVDGTVEVHDFKELLDQEKSQEKPSPASIDDEIDTILSSTPIHTQLLPSKTSESGSKQASCRAIIFADNGKSLYSGSTAGDLARIDTEIVCTFTAKPSSKSVLWRVPDASYEKSPIHVLHEMKSEESTSVTNGLIVTGDDAGGVRVWDPRLLCAANGKKSQPGRKPAGCVYSWKEHEDYISCIENSADGLTLLASSADCTLSIYDLRMAKLGQHQHVDKEKIVRRSDDQEDELLSLKIMKHGKKVVCGTGEGILSVFSWGYVTCCRLVRD
jgi:WD40 repeat protein